MKQFPAEPHLAVITALLLVGIVSALANVVQWGTARQLETQVDVALRQREEARTAYETLRAAADGYLAAEGKGCAEGVDVIDCLVTLATDLTAKMRGEEGIVAHVVETVEMNESFALPGKPNVQFTIRRVSRAAGGVVTAECKQMSGSDAPQFIFVRYAEPLASLPFPLSISLPTGTCLDASERRGEGFYPGLAVVEFEIRNDSEQSLVGSFLLLFYSPKSGEARDLLAEEYPPLGQSVPPFSSRRFRANFIIPHDEDEVRLLYGDYNPFSKAVGGAPLFEQSEGGFLIDFRGTTFSELPG